MFFLWVNLLRTNGLCSLTAHLTRNLHGGKQAERFLRKQLGVRCQRTTNCAKVRAASAGSPTLFCYRGGTDCFRVSPPTTSALHLSSLWTQCGHHIHTSAPVKAFPAPVVWLVLKPLQKLAAVILGRSLRKWWVALPANRQELFRQWAWQRRWHLAACVAIATVIVSLFLLTHLDETPVTGRTRLLVFSRESYIELAAITSAMHMEEFAELLVPVTHPEHQVVERLVQHLAQRNKDIPEVSDVSWNVHVVQSPTVNAFCLPNGDVYVFTGMLRSVSDLHQLAVILGHEMAHTVLAHSAEKASLSHIVDLISIIVLTAIWAVCPRDSLAVLGHWVQEKLSQLIFSRPYSRKLEAEADEVGLHFAAKACTDVRAAPVFWKQMEIRERLSGSPTTPEWLSTHPSHGNRVNQLDRHMSQALELRKSCDCPALPSTDPRAVFSKSVKVLLENTKQTEYRRGQEGAQKAPLTPGLTSLPTKLPAALLAQDALLPSSNRDQECKLASLIASDSAAPAPGPASADGEGSQDFVRS